MRNAAAALALSLLLAACAGLEKREQRALSAEELALLNRVTWGANASSAKQMAATSTERWLERQLAPPKGDDLPAEAAAQVAAMKINQVSMLELAEEAATQRRAFRREDDAAKRKEAQQAYQQKLTQLARETMTRSALRAVYSPWQLREQMTWFWMNHFSVFAGKARCAPTSPTTRKTRSGRMPSGACETCSARARATRRCCATSTMRRTPRTGSTRTTRAS
jgi:uncharacterized protein (DUF1800 family)